MRLTILNFINFNIFFQNINPISPFQVLYLNLEKKNVIWIKNSKVTVYDLGKKVVTDGIEKVSRINTRTAP